MKQISQHLFLYKDTCHVYVIRSGEKAVLIDFGAGEVLKYLSFIGVKEVTDIFMTHHHRDQAQGLHHAAEKGIRIWVPHMEQDLFHSVDQHWQAREIDNNYNMRQDRFSILHSVPIYDTLKDYSIHVINNIRFSIIPTPGHTPGSITVLAEIDGRNAAFSGDLIYAPGKVWSMAATQWSYNGGEGIALSVLSLLDLKDRNIDLLLPSHGQVMNQPIDAMNRLIDRFTDLMKERKQNPRLFQLREHPYEEVTAHLLRNRTSMANSYVLLSESGKALCIDFGYDFIGGMAAGADRAARRPWLYTLGKLKEQYGVDQIDVVIPTHFHDDHLAGFNLLKEVEGTEVWCPANFSNILEEPKKYNLPCLWYDPIHVDKELPLNEIIEWEEYEFTIYEQPGHTLYAVAIDFLVDGKRVLAIGDQYQGRGDEYNYVYQNKFHIEDYVKSANLYKKLKPDILISGHWDPVYVTDEYLQKIEEKGKSLADIHRDLLPYDDFDLGAEGFGATIFPYQTTVHAGESFLLKVEMKNPYKDKQLLQSKMIGPKGWKFDQETYQEVVNGHESVCFRTTITVPANVCRYRERIAVEWAVGEKKFGQQAEALITVLNHNARLTCQKNFQGE